MSNVVREFYEVEEAAKVLDVNLSDLWHLIEIGRIGASFRQIIAEAHFDCNERFFFDDLKVCHTFLMRENDAAVVAGVGKAFIKEVFLPLAEPPMEELIIDRDTGDEEIAFSYLYKVHLNREIELNKSDIVITQLSIDQYVDKYTKLHEKTNEKEGRENKQLSSRTENNYLRLILSLANGIKGFNPKKPYEAAQLIIDETGIGISKQTISDYITKAYELESQKRD